MRTVNVYARLTKTQFKIVDTLCFLSKNLYNVALYENRQHYHEIQLAQPQMDALRPDIISGLCQLTSTYIPYSRSKDNPFKAFSTSNICKSNENYTLLHSDAAQQTLQLLDENYQSFFKLLKLKLSGKYEPNINTPHYLKPNGRFEVRYPMRKSNIKGNLVTLGMSIPFRKEHKYTGKELTFKIPPVIKPHQLRTVKLLPVNYGECYKISFVYEIKKLPETQLDPMKYLGIDLGLNNFASLIDNATGTAILLDGKYLKSLNRWYNKTNAKLQSIKDKQGITVLTHRQHRLLVKRDNRINEAMNRYVHYIINHAVQNHIGNIVCLRWDGIKQNRKAKPEDNQNFIQIPYDKFRTKLEAKCAIYGITYHGKDSEAYTSRTDALAHDDICDQPYKKTRRIKRGLYKSITGHVINADINGSMNHIRKVAGDVPIQEIVSSGRFNRPVRVRFAYETISHSQQTALPQSVSSRCNPPVLTGGC